MSIDTRLEQMGIILPEVSAPLASYLPVVVENGFAHVSGQLPFIDGKVLTGRLGDDLSVEQGQQGTRACALMILAQLKGALVPLDRVRRIVKLGVFVASTPDFTEQHLVANGASDLMAEVFGDYGRHARAAVGVPALPVGAAVEVDAIIALAPD